MSATPREPFDAEEARIARLYGSLPRGEPSPALDARILAQARDAVAANAPAKRRPWIFGAGLGTAAAAVFAAGIAWQLGVFKPDHGLSSVPEQRPAAQEEVERIDIEFVKQEQERKREDIAPPPATAKPQPLGEAREQAGAGGLADKERDARPFPAEAPLPEEPAAPRPAAAPAAPPPPTPATEAASASMQEPVATEAPAAAVDAAPSEALAQPPADAAAEPASADAVSAQRREDARQAKDDAGTSLGIGNDADDEAQALARRRTYEPAATAGARAEPAPAISGVLAPGRTASNTAPRDELTARSARLAKLAGLPPWAEDAALAPEPWLERIRDRVQAGDRQGAEHSLRRFVLAHPDRPVPRDLQRLLVE